MEQTKEVTRLLQAWTAGDSGGVARLMPVVGDERHQLARHSLRQLAVGSAA